MKRPVILLCITFAAIITSPAQWYGRPTDVPAYHDSGFTKADAVPAVLTPDQLTYPASKVRATQLRAYELAAKIPQVIYQQPCYCFCDRGHGHKSLHSCFESEHGGNCAACLKELFYSYQMNQQKKTPAQIRLGIVAGEWQQIDLDTAASIGATPKPPARKSANQASKKASS